MANKNNRNMFIPIAMHGRLRFRFDLPTSVASQTRFSIPREGLSGAGAGKKGSGNALPPMEISPDQGPRSVVFRPQSLTKLNSHTWKLITR